MFHEICETCDLESEFPHWAMPPCYNKNKICGHIQRVNLDKAATTTLYFFWNLIILIRRWIADAGMDSYMDSNTPKKNKFRKKM